jgi:hypothetical protein
MKNKKAIWISIVLSLLLIAPFASSGKNVAQASTVGQGVFHIRFINPDPQRWELREDLPPTTEKKKMGMSQSKIRTKTRPALAKLGEISSTWMILIGFIMATFASVKLIERNIYGKKEETIFG